AFENHPHITTPFRAGYSRHVFHQYTLKLDAKENIAAFRNGLQEYLASKQIPSMIYYPVPAHRQKMFAAFGSDAVALPITDWLTDRVISLPMHTELSEAQLQYIAQEVLTYMNT
ncbi:MAG: transcriptional regulator, partial [Bacteroidetes bacterium]|nr:transcriptional regulator [Bacteroidota bacterium]